MIYVTPEQIRRIEAASDYAAQSFDELIDDAGTEVANFAAMLYADLATSDNSGNNDDSEGITILCGKGNNGADGLTAAYKLAEKDLKVTAVIADGEPELEFVAARMSQLREQGKAEIINLSDNMETVFDRIAESVIIIDAVYGHGFKGNMMSHEIMECFNFVRRCKAVKIAVDVPSGGDALTGETAHRTLKFDYTITFGYKKIGMLLRPLRDYCGEIIVADLGLTPDLNEGIDYLTEDVDEERIKSELPPRVMDSHKGRYGKLLNIAGCNTMSGAAAMSTLAALRCGVGLVRLASTEKVIERLSSTLYEPTFLPMTEDETGAISDEKIEELLLACDSATAVTIGSGLSDTNSTRIIVEKIIKHAECPIILDADGINCLTDNIDIIKHARNKLIITPNAGELARLAYAAKIDVRNRYTVAVEFAKRYGIIVVAKGMPTFVTGELHSGGKSIVCFAGNPGLSKGGSGDVLTGIIGALAAQGMETFEAAVAGVHIHGLAADVTAMRLSKTGMLPTDVIEDLPYVFKNWDR